MRSAFQSSESCRENGKGIICSWKNKWHCFRDWVYPGAQGRLELAPFRNPCIPFISKTGQELSWHWKKADTNPHGHGDGSSYSRKSSLFPWVQPVFRHLICHRPQTKGGRSDHYHIDESPRRLFSFSSWQRGSERNHKHGGCDGASAWVTSAAEGKSIGRAF